MAEASGKKSMRLREKPSLQSVDVKKARSGSSSESPPVEEGVSHLLGYPFLTWFYKITTEIICVEPTCPYGSIASSCDCPCDSHIWGQDWNLSYQWRLRSPCIRLRVDNDLECGDGCVFELVERISNSRCTFLARGDLPAELEAVVDSRGKTFNFPIVLD